MDEEKINSIIVENLTQFEQDHGIKILFAVESGSRTWGMGSKDSDYDVRFIYCYERDEYSRLFPRVKNTLELEGIEIETEQDILVPLDGVGWDLQKYLKLLVKSNPSAIEWALSDSFYIKHPLNSRLRDMSSNFNRLSLFMHYRSLALQNYKRFIYEKTSISSKKYLYVLRGQLNAVFILLFDDLPPMDLPELVRKLHFIEEPISNNPFSELIPLKNNIFVTIMNLIEDKKNHKEKRLNDPITELNLFIDLLFSRMDTIELDELKSRLYHIKRDEVEGLYIQFLEK